VPNVGGNKIELKKARWQKVKNIEGLGISISKFEMSGLLSAERICDLVIVANKKYFLNSTRSVNTVNSVKEGNNRNIKIRMIKIV